MSERTPTKSTDKCNTCPQALAGSNRPERRIFSSTVDKEALPCETSRTDTPTSFLAERAMPYISSITPLLSPHTGAEALDGAFIQFTPVGDETSPMADLPTEPPSDDSCVSLDGHTVKKRTEPLSTDGVAPELLEPVPPTFFTTLEPQLLPAWAALPPRRHAMLLGHGRPQQSPLPSPAPSAYVALPGVNQEAQTPARGASGPVPSEVDVHDAIEHTINALGSALACQLRLGGYEPSTWATRAFSRDPGFASLLEAVHGSDDISGLEEGS